jgi:hypothetical protein
MEEENGQDEKSNEKECNKLVFLYASLQLLGLLTVVLRTKRLKKEFLIVLYCSSDDPNSSVAATAQKRITTSSKNSSLKIRGRIDKNVLNVLNSGSNT